MAIKVSFNGTNLLKPQASSKTTVSLSGGFQVATGGTVGIIGEAQGGAPGSAVDIKVNSFTPDQFSQIVSTYKSGPIVDAAKLLFSPSADDRVTSGAQLLYVYKTNASTQASASLPTSYGTIKSLNYGLNENLINFEVDAGTSESKFSVTFNWMPDATSACTMNTRVNGGAVSAAVELAAATPVTVQGHLNALTGLSATGGTDRAVITTTGGPNQLALTSAGNVVTITRSGGTGVFDVTPTVGDTLQIPSGSILAGAGNANLGGYLVTAATTSVITAVKFGDPSVACANVIATNIVAATDLKCYAPIVLTVSGATPNGGSSSLEILDGGAAVPAEETLYGGVDRGLLTATQVSDGSTIALTVAASVGSFVISSAYAGSPVAGDMLWVRPGSPIAGGSLQNVGAWRVTAATSTTITATKISGSPITVGAADIAATTDVMVFKGYLSSSSVPILNTSSAETQITIKINRQSDNSEEDSVLLGGNPTLLVGYLGTTATLTISPTQLTTSVVGGSGANLALTLASFSTLNDLATYINAQTGYTCAVANALYGQFAPSVLGQVTAMGICASISGDRPGRIKKDSYEVQSFFDASQLVSLTRTSFVGLPTATATKVFLSGGVVGGSTAASVQAGLDAMQKVRVNTVVPLFSRDATKDVLESLTDPGSTYTIDAIHAGLKTHVLLMSNTKNRSERNGYASYKGTFVDSQTKSNVLASERVSLAIQDVNVLKTDGTLAYVQPWGMSCIAAGMQAGANIGEPMTHKSINISGLKHQDFDPAVDGDTAITNGILYAEQPQSGGFRIVVGNTTYGKDSNFVFNRISTLYAADIYAYGLRQFLEDSFIGVSSVVATPTAVKNAVIQYSQASKDAGVIVGDDTNEGLGFKNLIVTLTGNVMTVNITITPAQGVDFILASIVLDNIRASA